MCNRKYKNCLSNAFLNLYIANGNSVFVKSIDDNLPVNENCIRYLVERLVDHFLQLFPNQKIHFRTVCQADFEVPDLACSEIINVRQFDQARHGSSGGVAKVDETEKLHYYMYM